MRLMSFKISMSAIAALQFWGGVDTLSDDSESELEIILNKWFICFVIIRVHDPAE